MIYMTTTTNTQETNMNAVKTITPRDAINAATILGDEITLAIVGPNGIGSASYASLVRLVAAATAV